MSRRPADPPVEPALAARLLGRPTVAVDPSLIRQVVADRRVLVTGAGGTIGGELARLLIRSDVAELTMLDHSEPALFWIEQTIREAAPEIVVRSVLGSVTDRAALDDVLAEAGPDLVFHAAAYKHVALVEHNPIAGAEVNVLGTDTLLTACREAGVRDVLLISSDKAARPVSLMGATKRVAERLVASAAPAAGGWAAVRFGNVLGSSGSVLQVFRRRLESGLPLEVRDPRATRYFMTAEEAGQLLVLAAGVARPRDLLLLQIGEPLRIEDLAARLLAEFAASAGGVGVRRTRLLTGERLHDSPSGGLDVEPTGIDGIGRIAEPGLEIARLGERIERLREACAERDRARVVELVTALAR